MHKIVQRSQNSRATGLDEEGEKAGEADAAFLAKWVPSLAPPEPLISISM